MFIDIAAANNTHCNRFKCSWLFLAHLNGSESIKNENLIESLFDAFDFFNRCTFIASDEFSFSPTQTEDRRFYT